MTPMFSAAAAVISLTVTIIGLVTVFIKIGIDKGDKDRRIKVVEVNCEEIKRGQALLEREVHGMQRETSGFFGEVRADLINIKKAMDRIETKLERGAQRCREETK